MVTLTPEQDANQRWSILEAALALHGLPAVVRRTGATTGGLAYNTYAPIYKIRFHTATGELEIKDNWEPFDNFAWYGWDINYSIGNAVKWYRLKLISVGEVVYWASWIDAKFPLQEYKWDD